MSIPNGDPSHDLDLVTVFRSADMDSSFEAQTIQALLEAEGVTAVLIGDTRLPNFPYEVRVAREDAARSKELIAAAIAAGPQGAAEAESDSESER